MYDTCHSLIPCAPKLLHHHCDRVSAHEMMVQGSRYHTTKGDSHAPVPVISPGGVAVQESHVIPGGVFNEKGHFMTLLIE